MCKVWCNLLLCKYLSASHISTTVASAGRKLKTCNNRYMTSNLGPRGISPMPCLWLCEIDTLLQAPTSVFIKDSGYSVRIVLINQHIPDGIKIKVSWWWKRRSKSCRGTSINYLGDSTSTTNLRCTSCSRQKYKSTSTGAATIFNERVTKYSLVLGTEQTTTILLHQSKPFAWVIWMLTSCNSDASPRLKSCSHIFLF